MTKQSATSVMQKRFQHVPNILTIVRILLVPSFLLALFAISDPQWSRWTALIIFVVAMTTDTLDGGIARRFNLITDFGKVADPIADKAIMAAAFISLSIMGLLPWWMTIVMLAREIIITLWRLTILSNAVVPASILGKAKTMTQTLAVFLYLIPWEPEWFVNFRMYIMVFAVAATLYSGIEYFASRQVIVGISPESLVTTLVEEDHTIAAAESLTAGLFCADIVSVPGSSAVLRGGVIVYATDLKHHLGGVDDHLLATNGAVHPDTAVALAQEVRSRCGASIGVALTGVAGPEEQEGHPVGTVFIAVSTRQLTVVREYHWDGNREEIRQKAAGTARALVAEVLAQPA